jgi:hypothetical protein
VLPSPPPPHARLQDLDEKDSVIQKLRQQLGDLRHGLPPAAGAAPPAAKPAAAAAASGGGKGLQDAWRDDGAPAAAPAQKQPQQQPPRLRQPQQPAQAPPPPPPPGVEPAPKDTRQARALLVICYNRPEYLRRTLNAVLTRLPSYNRPHVYISQDGDEGAVTAVIGEFAALFAAEAPDVPFTHWRHPPVTPEALARAAAWALGYYKLAQHFGWALGRIFGAPLAHPRVIILEDDLEVAPDFFDYFTAVEPLLDNDASLLAASAWNDVGQAAYVADPTAVHRSDFFPGLGWMINSHVSVRRQWWEWGVGVPWGGCSSSCQAPHIPFALRSQPPPQHLLRRAQHWEELGPKWPDSFWDDWLREPPQRRGRAVLHPQVSRSYTFGEEGVSRAQFFAQYLGNIKLNDVPVDWASLDLSYLDRAVYDAALAADVARARLVGVEEAVTAVCPPNAAAGKDAPLPAVKTTYAGFDGPAGYEGVAQVSRRGAGGWGGDGEW